MFAWCSVFIVWQTPIRNETLTFSQSFHLFVEDQFLWLYKAQKIGYSLLNYYWAIIAFITSTLSIDKLLFILDIEFNCHCCALCVWRARWVLSVECWTLRWPMRVCDVIFATTFVVLPSNLRMVFINKKIEKRSTFIKKETGMSWGVADIAQSNVIQTCTQQNTGLHRIKACII